MSSGAAQKQILVTPLTRKATTIYQVEEYSESHRAFGLPDELLNILKDDLWQRGERDCGIS